MGLQLDISHGEVLRIGDAVITLKQKTGSKARLEITAPPSVKVLLEKEVKKFTHSGVITKAQECSGLNEEHSNDTNIRRSE